MLYHSYFKDTSNNRYNICIHTNYKERDIEEEFFIEELSNDIKFSSESDSLYKPYKCGSLDFSVYVDNPFELTKSFGHLNTFVQLKRNNRIVFQGYVTNNSLNTDFAHNKEFLNIQVQDSLSTLKYRPYKRIKTDGSSNVSFAEILFNMVGYLGTYRNLYITNSLVPSGDKTKKNLLELLFVSEDNFIGDKGEPMNCLEVLDEICKYLNVSCVPFGDSIYFVNYESIKNGFTSYSFYSLRGTEYKTTQSGFIIPYPSESNRYEYEYEVSLNDFVHLHKNDFADSNTQLSILSPKNKVVVDCDINPYEELIPELNDLDLYEQTKHNDEVGRLMDRYGNNNDNFKSYILENGKGEKVKLSSDGGYYTTSDGNRENITIFHINRNENIKYNIFLRYLNLNNATFDNLEIKHYAYHSNNVLGESILNENKAIFRDNILNYRDTQLNNAFCVPVQCFVQDLKDKDNEDYTIKFDKIDWWFVLSEFQNNQNWDNVLLEYKLKRIPITKDNYLVLSGSFELFQTIEGLPYRWNDTEMNNELTPSKMYIPMIIKSGNLYWDNFNKIWSHYKTISKIWLQHSDKSNTFNVPFPIKSNIGYSSFLGNKQGYSIPLDNNFFKDHIDFDSITIQILYPSDLALACKPRVAGLPPIIATLIHAKDLNFEVVTKDHKQRYIPIKDDNKSVSYENVLEDREEFIEKEKVETIFNTYIKGYNKSDVYYQDGDKFRYLSHILNRSNGDLLLPEQHIVRDQSDHYKEQEIHLLTNLETQRVDIKPYSLVHYHHIPYPMVVNKITQDFYLDTTELDLICKP